MTENNFVEPGKVLLEAADFIELHGKATGALSDYQGRVCAFGAIAAVVSDRDDSNYRAKFAAVRDVLSKHMFPRVADQEAAVRLVIVYNDEPTTTAKDVAAHMRAAAQGVSK